MCVCVCVCVCVCERERERESASILAEHAIDLLNCLSVSLRCIAARARTGLPSRFLVPIESAVD